MKPQNINNDCGPVFSSQVDPAGLRDKVDGKLMYSTIDERWSD